MFAGDIVPQRKITLSSTQNNVDTARTADLTQVYQLTIVDNATCLFVESDRTFLDPLHNFIRCRCIELFEVTWDDIVVVSPNGRYHSSKLGQVGLRCYFCKDAPREEIVKQAVCFPTKKETIFESVRNYQRYHFNACTCIPERVKAEYKILLEQDSPLRKPAKYVKSYYAEAAGELGLINTPIGLKFGAPPNTTGVPSKRLGALIKAAESPFTRSAFWKAYSSDKDDAIKLKKFEHVASDSTRAVIINARKEPTSFVFPQDFASIPDIDFLLFHQVSPCKLPAARLECVKLDATQYKALSALRCKHCDRDNADDVRRIGVYFPTTLASLLDSSFTITLLNHMMRCPHVPQEIKDALSELKQLAADHGIVTKRGSKKRFLEKVWTRMETHYNN
mmetsp:Transcript_24465/g.39818  ORF Transcript_24465/g.39818 Transcript_24465/m.39818 type:complete len:392 (-) Transcript_24465:272-1447(-)